SRPFWDRDEMVFLAGWLGGADSPNGDGLRWFMAEVLPHLRAAMPWARLIVTGADPPAALRDLEGPNLRFTGHVEDLDALFDRTRGQAMAGDGRRHVAGGTRHRARREDGWARPGTRVTSTCATRTVRGRWPCSPRHPAPTCSTSARPTAPSPRRCARAGVACG